MKGPDQKDAPRSQSSQDVTGSQDPQGVRSQHRSPGCEVWTAHSTNTNSSHATHTSQHSKPQLLNFVCNGLENQPQVLRIRQSLSQRLRCSHTAKAAINDASVPIKYKYTWQAGFAPWVMVYQLVLDSKVGTERRECCNSLLHWHPYPILLP